MTKRERFYRTIERKTVDYPASWLGEPVSAALPGLYAYFGTDSGKALKAVIGDDVYSINVPYKTAEADHIATALNFRKGTEQADYAERTLTAPGFFEDYHHPGDVDKFPWPDPAEGINPVVCRRTVEAAPADTAVMALMWSCHFQDACSAYGMDKALMAMILEPELYKAIMTRIVEFYLEANRIFYEAVKGSLDAVLIGNDFGSQTTLMLSPELLRKFVFPGTAKLIDQAHSYGLKVIHHSCGAIREIIPDLINLGVDVIHPIQALAHGMESVGLARDFGNDVSFCGGLDAQNLLVNGTPDQIRKEVRRLKTVFPTGLIISPSHEAILPDVDPRNVEALFKAVSEN